MVCSSWTVDATSVLDVDWTAVTSRAVSSLLGSLSEEGSAVASEVAVLDMGAGVAMGLVRAPRLPTVALAIAPPPRTATAALDRMATRIFTCALDGVMASLGAAGTVAGSACSRGTRS